MVPKYPRPGGVLAAQLEHGRGEVASSRLVQDLADRRAPGEEDQVPLLGQQRGRLRDPAQDGSCTRRSTWRTAARRIAFGRFVNSGHICTAPDHVLVRPEVKDELVAEPKQAIRDFYGDDPEQSQDYGRVINRRNFDRLADFLAHKGAQPGRACGTVSLR